MMTWSTLEKRLGGFYDSGEDVPEAVSDLSDGRGTRFYPEAGFGIVAKWLEDARGLAVSEGRHRIEHNLEETLKKFTQGKRHFAEIEHLGWSDFERNTDADPDEPGGYPDPINTRYRFQLLVEELLLWARIWANDPPTKAKPVPIDQPLPEIVTPQRAADWIEGAFGKSVAAGTIQNWVTMAKKLSPTKRVAWAEISEDGRRNTMIKLPEFLQYYRSGNLPPKQSRR